jgi:hypothetical protein
VFEEEEDVAMNMFMVCVLRTFKEPILFNSCMVIKNCLPDHFSGLGYIESPTNQAF